MPDVMYDLMTSSDLPDVLRVVYSAELMTVARPQLVYTQFAQRKTDLTGQAGDTVTWTVFNNLPPTISPLLEDQDVETMKLSSFQVSATVHEHGTAIGTTERLNRTSYHGPISSRVRELLSPQTALTMDLLARNAMIDKHVARYHSYAGGADSRATLRPPVYDAEGLIKVGVDGVPQYFSALSPKICKTAAYRLNTKHIPPAGGGYIALVHPSQTYDLSSSPHWKSVNQYTRPEIVLSGEVGMLYGIRFVETHNARLPNAGGTPTEITHPDGSTIPANVIQSTLSSGVAAGKHAIFVSDVTGFEVGQEITIHRERVMPDGYDPTEEHLVISGIDVPSKRITFMTKVMRDHDAGDYVTEGLDVYPLVFMGAQRPTGYAEVLPPEVRVALPTDSLRRQSMIGWYGILGYKVIRPWAQEVVEVTSGVNSAPAFPY